MISIYKIKPKFQQLLMPVLNLLHKAGITANQITIASILLSLGIGICFYYSKINHLLFLALPIGLFIRMGLNALDGMMARIHNQQSKKGELLNEFGDVISDLFIFIPLLYMALPFYLVFLFIILSLLNEFAGILGKAVSGTRQYDGPMGKSDRAFIVGLYALLNFFKVPMHPYAYWGLIAINLLIIISTAVRLKKSLANV